MLLTFLDYFITSIGITYYGTLSVLLLNIVPLAFGRHQRIYPALKRLTYIRCLFNFCKNGNNGY